MRADHRRGLPMERYRQIVRFNHPELTDDVEIDRIARELRAVILVARPMTQEQRDLVRVLLRPSTPATSERTG